LSPPQDWIENSEDLKEYQERYTYLYSVVILTFLTLFFRLWYLQILKGSEFKRFSEQNQIKEDKIAAPRGMILDRNGEILIDSLPAFSVNLTPQYVTSLDKVAQDLSVILDLKKDDIMEKVRFSRRQNGVFKPVHIKENISRDEVAKIERIKMDTPGLAVEMGIRRNYLLGENGAQFFGYTGEISKEELPILNATKSGEKFKAGDIIGKAGLEKRWDSEIRGIDGARSVVVDARGREIAALGRDQILGNYPELTDYVPGHNVTLTIDKDLQKVAFDAMKTNKRIGSVVAMNPQTGEILTMLNAPSFDPNSFSTGISPDVWAELVNDPFKPMRNKVIQDYFPPGSTFKAVVAIAAIEEKIVTPTTTFSCPGYLKFGKRPYHCWFRSGHGPMNIYTALERSCDVYFYHLGLLLGVDKIAKYARKLGFGSKTGILLDGERAGLIPDSEWKKRTLGEEWQPGENLSVTIGQGFVAVTPLQLLGAYAAIGMDGKVFKPYVISKIQDSEGQIRKVFEPELLRNAQVKDFPGDVSISPETFAIVKKGLLQVFSEPHGTGHSARIPGLDIAGKTGTAQLFQLSAENVYARCENREFKQRHNGWIVGFAPKDNPRIAVVVHAEHGCHGAAGAPILHDLMLAYFKKYAPDLLDTSNNEKTEIGVVQPAETED
jgi:penicillin-binding protein 2